MTAETEQKKPGNKKLIATVASTLLWVLSIVLAFVIKAGDRLIFIPDALLLLGFFPLLWLWRQGWATFLFGLFNVFIGFFLLLLRCFDENLFKSSQQVMAMREHLIQMHDYWTWALIGGAAMIWGLVDGIMAISRWLAKRRQAR